MFKDFYQNYTDCLICQEDLQTFASFVFLVRHRGQIEVAGDILYAFEPELSRFFKEACNPVFDGHQDTALYLDEAYDNIADSFNPLTKTFPRIGQSKLSKLINSPWHLSGIGVTYSKCCANDDHYFSYEAETIFGYDQQSYSLFAENLELHGIDINNLYNQNANKTMISSKKLGLNFSMPQLSINEWNTTSEQAFTNQVYKYAILQ